MRGSVVAGLAGKPGGVPLPGVSVTATNTITGKKFTTATDVDGAYSMVIPRNGRYVVRAELAGFALETQEVVFGGTTPGALAAGSTKAADFGLTLASRVAAAEAQQATTTGSAATGLAGGLQGLSLSAGGLDAATDASSAGTGANTGAALPSLGGLSDAGGGDATESVAVSGQTGQTNGLAGISQDDLRQRIEDAVAQGRANGSIPQGADVTGAIVTMIGGMMGGGGPGGGVFVRGGRGGGGGGGNFRNFNPAQPHGAIFYQGANSALNATQWLASAPGMPHFVNNPSAYSNNFGATFAGSPYIPGLTKPNTKQFVFINLTGRKNLNAFAPDAVRVPTPAGAHRRFLAVVQQGGKRRNAGDAV